MSFYTDEQLSMILSAKAAMYAHYMDGENTEGWKIYDDNANFIYNVAGYFNGGIIELLRHLEARGLT